MKKENEDPELTPACLPPFPISLQPRQNFTQATANADAPYVDSATACSTAT